MKPKLIFVGSFVVGHKGQGGQHAQCQELLTSPFADRCEMLLIDSTPPKLPPPAIAVRGWLAFKRLIRFIWKVQSQRPDAALIFCSGGMSFVEKGLMCVVCRLNGIPTVLSVRSGVFVDQVNGSLMFRFLARFLFCFASRVMCQGDPWLHFYQMRFGLDDKKLFLMRNWITPGRLSHISIAKRFSRIEPFRILFVGWITKQKGIFELLNAFSAHQELQDAIVDVVGDGIALKEVRAKAIENGIEKRFRTHGWMNRVELEPYFEAADLLVLPSYAEGFPNVILEAMAAGLPVISTRVGGVPDVIRPGLNGILIPIRDMNALSEALAELKRSPGVRKRMGELNRAEVIKNHDIETAGNRLWCMLCSLSPKFTSR